MAESLTLEQEYPRSQIPDTPWWSENYVVVFYAADIGVSGFFHIGRWPWKPDLWRSMCAVALPQDRILLSRNFGKSVNPKIPCSGVLSLEIVEPERKLRYVFDGPADERLQSELATAGYQTGRTDRMQYDIVFESDQPMWDQHAGISADDKMENNATNHSSSGGHIEQCGVLNGSIRYGTGEIYKLTNVPANRDHSRGTRNVTPYRTHIWANGHFPDGSHFNVWTLTAQGVDGIPAGSAVIVRDGKLYQAKVALDTEGWLRQPEQLLQPFTLILDCPELGRQEIRAMRMVNSWPNTLLYPADMDFGVPANSRYRNVAFICEQSVIWHWGNQEGTGHLERGNSSFDSNSAGWQNNFIRK